jgi:hypothetical protein
VYIVQFVINKAKNSEIKRIIKMLNLVCSVTRLQVGILKPNLNYPDHSKAGAYVLPNAQLGTIANEED